MNGQKKTSPSIRIPKNVIEPLTKSFEKLKGSLTPIPVSAQADRPDMIEPSPNEVINVCLSINPVLNTSSIFDLLKTGTNIEIGTFPTRLWEMKKKETKPENIEHYQKLAELGLNVYIEQLKPMIFDYVTMQTRQSLTENNEKLLSVAQSLEDQNSASAASILRFIVQDSDRISKGYHSFANGLAIDKKPVLCMN